MREDNVKVTVKITVALPKGAIVIPEEEKEGWSQLWQELRKDREAMKEDLLREEKKEEAVKKYRWYMMDDRFWS